MKIIKRNGAEEDFDNNKIIVAVSKANTAAGKNKLSIEQIKDIADYVKSISDEVKPRGISGGDPGYGGGSDHVYWSL